MDKRIGSDCKSLVDYVNEYRRARIRNEVWKLPLLLAIQQYLQRDEEQQVRWVRLHPERRKTDQMEFDLDEWGIYIADCYASNKNRPAGLHGQAITTTAEQLVRNVFLRQSWYLGTTNGIPLMTDPKRREVSRSPYARLLENSGWSRESRGSVSGEQHVHDATSGGFKVL
jgi:hypothetical protein